MNTPQALVAEGVAEVGLHALVGTGWGRWAAAVLSDVGLGFDGDLAEHVARAWAGLARVRSDAAVMLHDRHAPTEDVVAHLRRWLLVDDARARLMLGFLAHPLWRAYAVTYVEGAALVRKWLDRAGPDAAVDAFPDAARRADDAVRAAQRAVTAGVRTCSAGAGADDRRCSARDER